MQRLIASRKERLELTKEISTTAGGIHLNPGKDLLPLPGERIFARAPPVACRVLKRLLSMIEQPASIYARIPGGAGKSIQDGTFLRGRGLLISRNNLLEEEPPDGHRHLIFHLVLPLSFHTNIPLRQARLRLPQVHLPVVLDFTDWFSVCPGLSMPLRPYHKASLEKEAMKTTEEDFDETMHW